MGQRREFSGGLGETRGIDWGGQGEAVRSSPVRGMRGRSLSITAELPKEKREEEDPGRVPALWA